MSSLLQYFVNGLVFSSIIVLGSVGLSIVYSIADFANFAHGDTLTIGAYGALVALPTLSGIGGELLGLPLGFYGALLVGMALAAAVAVATELVIYRPLDTDAIGMLITSIGVAFVYRAVYRRASAPISGATASSAAAQSRVSRAPSASPSPNGRSSWWFVRWYSSWGSTRCSSTRRWAGRCAR